MENIRREGYVKITIDLAEVNTRTLIQELLTRREVEDIEVINSMIYQYLKNRLDPKILNKATPVF